MCKSCKYDKEMLLTGALLCLAGGVMQLCLGSMNWSLLAWPVNIVILLLFIGLLIVIRLTRHRFTLFGRLTRPQAALPALLYTAIVTLLLVLIPQHTLSSDSYNGDGGIWGFHRFTSSWLFILPYLWLMVVLGLTILKHCTMMRWRTLPFLLNHAGLFIALAAAVAGNADRQEASINLYKEIRENNAVDLNRKVVPLPFAIELDDLERVDGRNVPDMAQQMVARIKIIPYEGTPYQEEITVNHPATVAGWSLYQKAYEQENGRMMVELLAVRNPWLPAVYTGILMLMGGALALFLLPRRKTRKEAKP